MTSLRKSTYSMRRGRRVATSILASAFVIAVSAPASAQREGITDIEVADDAVYDAEISGVAIPPKAGGFERFRVTRYRTDADMSATYSDDESDSFATVYLTRVGTPDPYLWQHRVSGLIARRDGWTPKNAKEAAPRLFTAPNFERPSGVRASFATTGGDIKSTAMALFVYGNILVKIRVSSTDYDVKKIDAAMDRFIAGFTFPQPMGSEPEAYQIAPCADALEFDPSAKQVEPSGARALEYAISATAPTLLGGKSDDDFVRARYCLDASTDERFSIYRPSGSKQGYLLSYNDTGKAVIVGRAYHATLASIGYDDEPSQGYSIAHQLPDATIFYAGFDKLPSPLQAAQIPGNSKVISTLDYDRAITITQGLD